MSLPAQPASRPGDPVSFYRRDGEHYLPTGIVISPWNGRTQNGVALAGLVAHLIDTAPSLVPMSPTRLTIDILGAVPMAPLSAAVEMLRDGARFQTIAVSLMAENRVWVRATALRMRIADSPVFEEAPLWPHPDANEVAEAATTPGWLQLVSRRGALLQVGPGAQWLRFVGEVVEGKPMSPFERLAIGSDFGSGVGALLPVSDWRLANVDISVSATRLPEGEWLLVDSVSESAGNGIGIANTRIGDRRGMFASAH